MSNALKDGPHQVVKRTENKGNTGRRLTGAKSAGGNDKELVNEVRGGGSGQRGLKRQGRTSLLVVGRKVNLFWPPRASLTNWLISALARGSPQFSSFLPPPQLALRGSSQDARLDHRALPCEGVAGRRCSRHQQVPTWSLREWGASLVDASCSCMWC